jgi:hypothetical protein
VANGAGHPERPSLPADTDCLDQLRTARGRNKHSDSFDVADRSSICHMLRHMLTFTIEAISA